MIRTMTFADLDAVLALDQSLHTHPWTLGNFADALNAGNWLLVEENDGGLRAYAVALPGVEEAELLTIGVAAGYQRLGLGRALLEAIQHLARNRGMTRLFLEVRPSNVAALMLYRRTGFLEIGRRRNYYPTAGGREDAILMEGQL